MTKKEIRDLSRQCFMRGEIIKSGWILSPLYEEVGTQKDATGLIIQYAYFLGAKYIIDLTTNPPPGKSQKELAQAFVIMVQSIRKEFAVFFEQLDKEAEEVAAAAEAEAEEGSNNLH